MTTKLTVNNLTPETLAAISGPRISNVQIVDSQYNTLDDTAANVGGGYIIINGQSFNSAAQVLIDQTPATTITWVSNTQIRAEIPASTEGASKSVYVINPDGSLALLVNGLTYSAFPAWSTGSTLTSSEALVPISIQLSAPSATVYTLAAANTLPSSLSLYANGLIAGTVAANTTTNYNFTVNAKDAENQDTSRNFTLPITRNVEPAWTTAANLGSALVNENYSNTLVATDLSSITYSVAVGSSLPANLTLAANGLLSGSVSSANTYSFAIVATDTANLSNTRTFSISITQGEPYSPYTTLLLNGEGTASTNGANNNVFIDSSTNNFNIQRNGNTSQGTFSPYGSNWSNYFDGTGDYLNTPYSATMLFSANNFTIEAFIYPTTAGVLRGVCNNWQSGGEFYLDITSGNVMRFGYNNAASGLGTVDYIGTTQISATVWTHVAVVRNGNSLSMYINGVLDASGSRDVTGQTLYYYNGANKDFRIGVSADLTGYFTGYISNLRVVNGTAVYTSAFTPPTSPLTAIANTSLLTCQSNRLIDKSTNNFTLTRNGDVSVQAFHPFLQSATNYTPSVNGGSAYFDGTGDYLTALYNSNYNIPASTPFTLEGWAYTTATSEFHFVNRNWNYGGTGPTYAFYLASGTTPNWSIAGAGSATYVMMNPGTAGILGQWNHYAWTRDANNVCRIFTNGVEATGSTRTDSQALTSSSGNMFIGVSSNLASNYTNGYLSDLRLVVGTCIYTGNFIPPTSPLTAIANTSLLTNFTNAGIIDQTGKNNLETLGGAQLSTAVKKYNNASIYFDGTGDYLYSPPNLNYAMGSGNFTIEFWYYPVTHTNTDPTIMGNYNATWTSNKWAFHAPHASYASKYSFWVNNYAAGSAILVSTSNITNGAWAHIAITRSGSTWRMFVNGTIQATTTSSVALDGGTAASMDGFYIGANFYSSGGGRHINAYIDDLRITKGYARYTANVTPPTAIT
jgi:hypothetical protein